MADDLSKDLNLLRKFVSVKTKLNSAGQGLCPFHEDRSPSFSTYLTNTGKARFNCFGCGANGDIFDFLNRTEGLNFAAAKKLLLGNAAHHSPLEGNTGSMGRGEGELPLVFCERDCPKYAALRDDYNYLLEEVMELKARR